VSTLSTNGANNNQTIKKQSKEKTQNNQSSTTDEQPVTTDSTPIIIFPYQVNDIALLASKNEQRKEIIELRNQLIIHYHSIGHRNYHVMSHQMMKDGYSWRRLSTNCQDYCLQCDSCQKVNQQKSEPVPISPAISSAPFEFVQMDVFGPLYQKFTNKSTKRYCLVIIDILSGYVALYPMSDIKSETIASKMLCHCSHYGAPLMWQSDNASYFKTKQVQDMVSTMKSKYRFSAAYRPQSNGRVERSIKSIKELLDKLIEDGGQHDDWEHIIYSVQAYMNMSSHYIYDFSPFEILFSHQPRFLQFNQVDSTEFTTSLARRLEQLSEWSACRSEISDLIRIHRRNASEELNKKIHHEPKLLQVDDQVMIPNPNKLSGESRFIGPFVITEVSSDFTYKLRF
jgi:transposase InsO family protein